LKRQASRRDGNQENAKLEIFKEFEMKKEKGKEKVNEKGKWKNSRTIHCLGGSISS
jgi:hypothetical protein